MCRCGHFHSMSTIGIMTELSVLICRYEYYNLKYFASKLLLIQLISCILNWEMCRYGDRYLILKLVLVITFMEMCRCVLIMILSKYICSILFIAIKLNKWEVCRCADKYLFIKLSNIKML